MLTRKSNLTNISLQNFDGYQIMDIFQKDNRS